MGIDKLVHAIKTKGRRTRHEWPATDKWQSAGIGAAITLVLTLAAASLQYLVFQAPSEFITELQNLQKFSAEFSAEANRDDKLVNLLQGVEDRADKRQLILLSINSTQSLQGTLSLQQQLGFVRETLQDKGDVEGFLGTMNSSDSPTRAVVDSLDIESKVWNFMLDSKATDSREKFWRASIQLAESTHRTNTEYHLWKDGMESRLELRKVEIAGYQRRIGLIEFKFLIAAIYVLLTTAACSLFGARIATYIMKP